MQHSCIYNPKPGWAYFAGGLQLSSNQGKPHRNPPPCLKYMSYIFFLPQGEADIPANLKLQGGCSHSQASQQRSRALGFYPCSLYISFCLRSLLWIWCEELAAIDMYLLNCVEQSLVDSIVLVPKYKWSMSLYNYTLKLMLHWITFPLRQNCSWVMYHAQWHCWVTSSRYRISSLLLLSAESAHIWFTTMTV